MHHFRLAAVLVLLPLLLFARTPSAGNSQKPVVNIAVENISLYSVTSDRVQLTASVSVLASRKVTLHEVVFDQLNANGIPFYASPIQDRLVLVPNQKLLPLKPLLLTVYLRDLVSLKPLHSLVEDGKFSITGTAYASVDLNPAEKLFLFTGHVRVPVKIDSAVELRIPGGAIARATALILIDHVQGGLESAGSAWQSAARLFSEQREWLWKSYEPALVLAHATYELRNGTGKRVQFESTAMGFRVSGNRVVLPKSVLEPWKFDPYVAASMQQDGSLKVSEYELTLWPANSKLRDDAGQLNVKQAWRLSTHQIRLLPLTKDDSEGMFLPVEEGKIARIRIHRRQGAASLGLVEIIDPTVPAMNPILAAPGKPGSSDVESLAVFRFPEGIEAKEARPRLLLVPAGKDGSRLELDTSIDSSGWGSPVISMEGIVGVVTNEHSTLPIAEAAKALNFNTAQPRLAGER
jgi:hypothetical protein